MVNVLCSQELYSVICVEKGKLNKVYNFVCSSKRVRNDDNPRGISDGVCAKSGRSWRHGGFDINSTGSHCSEGYCQSFPVSESVYLMFHVYRIYCITNLVKSFKVAL